MKKRAAALILAMIMMVCLIPHTLAEGGITTAEQLEAALNAGGTVTLTKELNLEGKNVYVNQGVTVTLDLNGKRLDFDAYYSTREHCSHIRLSSQIDEVARHVL